MSGFESLPQAQNEGQALAPVQAEETAFSGETLSDADALKIVLQDVQLAEKFALSKNRAVELNNADNLFHGVVRARTWPGSDVARASLSMPVVLEAVERLLPSVYLAFFSDSQPFLLEPLGKTTPEAARAKSKVLQWVLDETDFKEECRRILKSSLLYGMGVGKIGWQTVSKTKKVYERDPQTGKIAPKTETYDISCPQFEYVDLRNIVVDPGLRTHDIRQARYVIQQSFITADELDALRDDYQNVPTREELAAKLAANAEDTKDSLAGLKPAQFYSVQAEKETAQQSADPLKNPLEILEYWAADGRVITVLNRVIVLRNEISEFGGIPFVSCAFIDVNGSWTGFGIARLIGQEQRLQNGVINSYLDTLALQLNPSFQLSKGVGVGTQQVKVSPGKVITESGELKPLPIPSVSVEAMNALSASEARAVRRVGASAGDMPTQALRTAEGVQAFSSGLVERTSYFVDQFASRVFVPALERFLELAFDHLEADQIQNILTDADQKAFESVDVLDVYNARCSVRVLSSTKLAARRAAAQMIPTIVQLAATQPFQESLTAQGKKMNYAQLLETGLELLGWSVDSLIVDMTPEDQQRAQMMNPAVIKAQSDQQIEAQRHQNAMEQIDEQGAARAGASLIRDAVKQSGQAAEAMMGQQLLNVPSQQPQQ